jgi:co-chaperonin GroES (HSP10)
MNSVYDFIVKPIGDRYDNVKKIGDKELVLNTKVENWKFVNRFAEIISTPLAIATPIKKGDIVVIHQNVFRRFYNMQGKQTNSRSYFKDNMYFVSIDQVYLYKRNKHWNSINDRCFVSPVKNTDVLSNSKELNSVGILKIGNNSLDKLGITPGSVVTFKLGSEWEFNIEEERLYCMKSNDILLEHGYKENQTEYNPSWARGSRGVNQSS